jgi:hypothetical protein
MGQIRKTFVCENYLLYGIHVQKILYNVIFIKYVFRKWQSDKVTKHGPLVEPRGWHNNHSQCTRVSLVSIMQEYCVHVLLLYILLYGIRAVVLSYLKFVHFTALHCTLLHFAAVSTDILIYFVMRVCEYLPPRWCFFLYCQCTTTKQYTRVGLVSNIKVYVIYMFHYSKYASYAMHEIQAVLYMVQL